MKTTILTIIALLLAIPTYGISLIVWFFIKYKYDRFSAGRVLINAAIQSYNNNGENQIRYAVNNAGVRMLYYMYEGKIINDIDNTVSGLIIHPVERIPLIVTMTQISGNRLIIKATRAEEEKT